VQGHERRLSAAQGYADLGMLEEAIEELDGIPSEFQERPETLEIRLLVMMRGKLWESALEIGRKLTRLYPHQPAGFIHAAFCLHELGDTLAAKQILMKGPPSIVNEPTYYYNLACYEAILGNREAAVKSLNQSFKIDKKFREFAKSDPDLDCIRGLI